MDAKELIAEQVEILTGLAESMLDELTTISEVLHEMETDRL